jgi:hypothetical protein
VGSVKTLPSFFLLLGPKTLNYFKGLRLDIFSLFFLFPRGKKANSYGIIFLIVPPFVKGAYPMCIACMEYLKGNLRDSEFKKNLREYADEEHDPKALAQVEITEEEIQKNKIPSSS